MGCVSPQLDELAESCRADLYLLTGDEIPFVADGLRDGESIRHEMHRWFEEALWRQAVRWISVGGNPAERLAKAAAASDEFRRVRHRESGGF